MVVLPLAPWSPQLPGHAAKNRHKTQPCCQPPVCRKGHAQHFLSCCQGMQQGVGTELSPTASHLQLSSPLPSPAMQNPKCCGWGSLPVGRSPASFDALLEPWRGDTAMPIHLRHHFCLSFILSSMWHVPRDLNAGCEGPHGTE